MVCSRVVPSQTLLPPTILHPVGLPQRTFAWRGAVYGKSSLWKVIVPGHSTESSFELEAVVQEIHGQPPPVRRKVRLEETVLVPSSAEVYGDETPIDSNWLLIDVTLLCDVTLLWHVFLTTSELTSTSQEKKQRGNWMGWEGIWHSRGIMLRQIWSNSEDNVGFFRSTTVLCTS